MVWGPFDHPVVEWMAMKELGGQLADPPADWKVIPLTWL